MKEFIVIVIVVLVLGFMAWAIYMDVTEIRPSSYQQIAEWGKVDPDVKEQIKKDFEDNKITHSEYDRLKSILIANQNRQLLNLE